jgi:hypothetical protein
LNATPYQFDRSTDRHRRTVLHAQGLAEHDGIAALALYAQGLDGFGLDTGQQVRGAQHPGQMRAAALVGAGRRASAAGGVGGVDLEAGRKDDLAQGFCVHGGFSLGIGKEVAKATVGAGCLTVDTMCTGNHRSFALPPPPWKGEGSGWGAASQSPQLPKQRSPHPAHPQF